MTVVSVVNCSTFDLPALQPQSGPGVKIGQPLHLGLYERDPLASWTEDIDITCKSI